MKNRIELIEDISKYVDCLSYNQSNNYHIENTNIVVKFELIRTPITSTRYLFWKYNSIVGVGVIYVNNKHLSTVTAQVLHDLQDKVTEKIYEIVRIIELLNLNKEQFNEL